MNGTARGVRVIIGIVVAGAQLGGCGFTQAPGVRVAGARVVSQTDASSVVEFDLEATNEGGDPLPLRRVAYWLDAGGRRVFEGDRSPQVTVPPHGQIRFTLPVSLPIALGDEPIGYVLGGTISYVAPGPLADAMYDNGIRRPSVAFADEGTLVGAGSK